MRDIYITANDNNDAKKESESQDSLASSETMHLRRSMFGITSPLYRSTRRNTLEDFDDIRSILSHSKVEEKWESFVNEDGGVFYVDVHEDSHQVERSRRQRPATARARHHRRRQNSRCPCHCKQQNSKNSEMYENNVKEKHENITPQDDNSAVNTNYLESLIDFQSQILANGEDNNGNVSFETNNIQDNSLGLKQVSVSPKEQAKCPTIHRDPVSEILHFQAFFGATLCHYNQCAQPQAGVLHSSIQETKLVVQYVEPDSPAAKAGVVKGDILLCLDDLEASLFFEGGLIYRLPKQSMKWTLKPSEETNSPTTLIIPTTFQEDSAETMKARKQIKKSILQLISRGVNPKVSSFLKKLTQHLVSDAEELKVR